MTNQQKGERIQKIVFNILCDIDDFCREHEIRYFLSGGSCLGAVRHQGFIPWDDDADLMMPRKDYERFIKLFAEQKPEHLSIGALPVDPDWELQYCRVWDNRTRIAYKYFDMKDIGVLVDIFPIDGLPKSKIGQRLFYSRLKIVCEIGKESHRKDFRPQNRFRVLRHLIQPLAVRIGARRIFGYLNRIAERYDFDTSEYVACSMPVHYGERETIPRACMESEVRLPFEGRLLPVPVGYETYLANLYGDYMEIPKEAEKNGFSHLDGWIVEFER